ncbi:Uncharacterised protein [Burkholderia pseudomallei]|uniref:hypothetical protein n=1 Tax=Burkholderia pseudomallei TaxID=28450 RepID=UPI000F077AE7|nr:hypothetical protein [Burkholderia pseudomallei]CAJ2904745.1 Uncharacterised protein [Burkholderia pseudomallei]VCG48172.1 Uncharacterised protein [Burkholderia pseudomallei]VCG67354.1 Uncharacterised protein [Burkholderia pseudomallei]VCG69644.1 Uncharacterised protein [Burkholderia pseudomallei]VCG73599.1 Uncharacterised protein [Burkholderia pseudomallei]
MLFLKCMSDQDLPDEDQSKHYTLYPIPDRSALSFGASDVNPKGVRASWFTEDGLMTVELEGNAYVLNAQGKTIASHAAY